MVNQQTAQEALHRLEALIGDWRLEARWPNNTLGPASGHARFEWHESRMHVVQHASIDIPEAPDSVSIIGCDAANGTYIQLYTDERVVCRICVMTITDTEWTLTRVGEPFAQRYLGTISPDGNTITGRWELAEDMNTFRTDFELDYHRMPE